MDESSPAQVALKMAMESDLKRRRGRPRACLLQSLKDDVKKNMDKDFGLHLLPELKKAASDKKFWKDVFTYSASVLQTLNTN